MLCFLMLQKYTLYTLQLQVRKINYYSKIFIQLDITYFEYLIVDLSYDHSNEVHYAFQYY